MFIQIFLCTFLFEIVFGSTIEFETPDVNYNYVKFVPNSAGFVNFRVRAQHDACIALLADSFVSDPMYEVILGQFSNTKSEIRKNRKNHYVGQINTPAILSGSEYRGFWIRWNNGTISFGADGSDTPFLTAFDREIVPIRYLSFSTGFGSTGSWVVDTYLKWVPSSRDLPPNAFLAGEAFQTHHIFIARAQIGNSLIVGKLVPEYGVYIPFNGTELHPDNFEVLCDVIGTWIATSGSNILPNAISGGITDYGEVTFIGRGIIDGKLLVGNVVPSKGQMYIVLDGKTTSFSDYYLLVNNADEDCTD